MSLPFVYIIVLGWNRTDDSVECLESVLVRLSVRPSRGPAG